MQSISLLARNGIPGWLSMFCPQTRLQGLVLGINIAVGAGCKAFIDRSLQGRVQEIESESFANEVEKCEDNHITVHGKYLSQQMLWTAGAVLAVFATTFCATVLASKNTYTSSDVYLTLGASLLPAFAKELYNFKNFKKSDAFATLVERSIADSKNGCLDLTKYPHHLSYALNLRQVESLAEKAEEKGLNTLELKNFPCDGYKLFGLQAFLGKFKTIDFTGFKGDFGGFVRDSLRLEKPETLTLSHIRLSKRYLEKIAKSFPNLKTLDITGCLQAKEGAFTVDVLKEMGFKKLETLYQNQKDFFMALILDCKKKKLKEVDLTPHVEALHKLSPKEILELTVFAEAEGLSKFSLSVRDQDKEEDSIKVHKGSFGTLSGSLASLESLDISGTFLTEDNLPIVSRECPSIKVLNIMDCLLLPTLTIEKLKEKGFERLGFLIQNQRDFFMALMLECEEKKLKEFDLTPHVEALKKLSPKEILELTVFAEAVGISKFSLNVRDQEKGEDLKNVHEGSFGTLSGSLALLESLDISGTVLTEENLPLVSRECPNIKTLILKDCPELQSLTLEGLKEKGFKHLERLIRDEETL